MKRLLVCLLLLSVQALADERILEFHSEILVISDGWIDVTETIKVRARPKPGRELRSQASVHLFAQHR